MSSLRRVLPTVLLWLAMVIVLLGALVLVEEAAIAERVEWANAELDEILEEVAISMAFDEDEREINLHHDEWPSFATFREAYVQAIRERPITPATTARLVLLGETTAGPLPVLPEQILHLMLEETPEYFHDRIEQLAAIHWDGLESDEEADLRAPVRSLEVFEWLAEQEVPLADRHECAAVRVAGATMASNIVELPVGEFDHVLAYREPFDDDGEDDELPCVVVRREVRDGSVYFGLEPPAALILLEEIAALALLAASLVGALAIGLAWAGGRRDARQLSAVAEVCRRAAEGDYGARVPADGGGALDRVATDVNRVLERTETLMDSLRTMSANIAHDLRTPLTRLRGQIDLLVQTPNPEPAMVAAVQAEADQLLDTFSALLRIAQVESGSLRGGFRDFDLAALLRDAAELYEPAFEERQLSFSATIPPGPCVVHGDLDLWMQSIANLMDNVLKYVLPGGRASVTLLSDDDWVTIRVRDSGPGVPELELDRVLDRFYRLPKHRGEQGNGLGLSLVAAVCQLHDATLALRNDDGLVVEIRWPMETAS
ncbi:MAG: HAMP domain-containing sensor histidine kinase [Pseudomonadota bacterium]